MFTSNSSTSSSPSSFLTSSSFISFAAVSIVSYLYHYHENRRKNRLKQCPIPMTLPEECHVYLGHANEFRGNKINSCKKIMVDNANQDGLSCFYLFHNICVSITKSEHLKELLQTCTYRIVDEKIDRHIKKILGEKSLLVQFGDEWKSNRHIVAKSFRWEYLQEMVPTMNDVANSLVEYLLSQQGKVLQMLPIMKCATLDVIGRTAFGYNFHSIKSLTDPAANPKQSALANAFEYMGSEYKRRQFEAPFDPFAFYYDIPTPANLKVKRAKRLWVDTMIEIIQARREDVRQDYSKHADMLATLLDAHDDETNQKMDELTLVDNLITLLFAGFDTSSIALTYALYLLAKYPDVEARCLAEINEVLGETNLPTYADLTSKFPFCTAVIQETLRLYPPAPMTSRGLNKPLVLSSIDPKSSSVTIPAGTRIVIPIWWVNRDPNVYDNPGDFVPDRFMPENIDKIPRYGYLPFSAGARDCVGRRFALLELVSMFVLVTRQVKFSLINPSYVVEPASIGVVQAPKDSLPLRIAARVKT